jgi:predicted transcriptional regulator of viral defense system
MKMMSKDMLKKSFEDSNGILRTSELNKIGLSSRQITKLVEEKRLVKLKNGVYRHSEIEVKEEIIIAKLFPGAVLFLESALERYGYLKEEKNGWKIAVDRDSAKSKYRLNEMTILPFYLERKYLEIGITECLVDGVPVLVYDKEKTVCDCLKYKNKLNPKVYKDALLGYITDKEKNVDKLMEYAKLLRVEMKVKNCLEMWL